MKPAHVIAFFTGQSDPGRCALSPVQESFLNQLRGEDRELVRANFPFTTPEPFRRVPLLRGSWNNARQYFGARRQDFSAHHREKVATLIQRGDHTLFLAGSCGLELFNNLGLPQELEERCTLVCYGPVARRLPRYASAVIVQSSRDFISRAFFRHPQQSLHCSHLGYLRDAEFLRICQAQLSGHPTVSCSNIFA